MYWEKKILVPCLDVLYVVDVTVANNKWKTMVLYDFLFGEGGGGRGNNVHDAVGERRLNNEHHALGENGSTFNFLSIRKIVTR